MCGQFSLGNLEAQRDWGHAKDYVEVFYIIFYYFAVKYTNQAIFSLIIYMHIYIGFFVKEFVVLEY